MSSSDFYRNTRAYDVAFGNRNFTAECDFLGWCLKTHGQIPVLDFRSEHKTHSAIHPKSPTQNLKSFLEVACGPARHTREFARRGWRATGLDLSEDMLRYAADRAMREGVAIETVCADMCNFTLEQPVALAANLMESLTHLLTNEQVVSHLRAVARNLLPGGIFVIEMAHPACSGKIDVPNTWTEREDDMTVDILFGLPDDPYDPITQQWTITSQLAIRENGQPTRVVESHNQHRWYGAQELAALAELSGAYQQVWWYGNLTLPPQPFDNSDEAERMVVVLRK